MAKLTGKVAVVTGASKGIGAGIAKALGAEGASVVVNYSSDKAGADKTVQAITGAGGKAIAVQASVEKAADVERLFAETEKAFGPANVLVNNAGVFEFIPLEAITEEKFHRQFNINVLGPLLTAQAAARHFGDTGGSIINIGSNITTIQFPASTVYAATKGGLDQITGVLANELGPKGIRVNSINPGTTTTEGAAALGFTDDSEMAQGMVNQTPLGRMGKPEDIGKLAVFLASDDSNWITGELIRSSGGLR
jgi:3-oxoacyl-[acyl-carrier protein] reductase